MKKAIKVLALSLFLVLMLVGCSDEDNGTTNNNSSTEESETKEEAKWYDGIISETLAKEIETALEEIKVDDEIKGLRLEEERKTDLFVRRVYVLNTKGYSYYVYSREWFECEPEYLEHPTEYLTAIGGSGLDNILWAEDGSGKDQTPDFSTNND